MISQRYAVAPRAVGVSRGGLTTWKARLSARPAIAGRERLAEALGRSVLVQLMLAVAFVALAGLFYMAQQSQVSVQEINISVLRSERLNLVTQNTALGQRAAALSSESRLDAAATTQLHMVSPDDTSTVWVQPVVPRLRPIPAPDADALSAQRASQPLAWMQRAVQFVKSSM